ncbi:MAG: hypothetical protein M1824_002173 [Vezdaea acicularis]|nr:MAG: hypothetical protein M1824_002173 [Vezdaea acicularis]
MSVDSINVYVRIIPNADITNDTTDYRVDSAYSFALDITDDLQTLSTNSAPPGDLNQGLLYVPDLLYGDPCINASRPYIPANVTRQANLPPTNDYALIALAPWISRNCTLGYLAAARRDPARAFIFYLTNRDSDDEDPPPISDPAWSLQDGGSWKSANKYPVYAISSHRGGMLMHQLSAYSGNMTNVPYGHELTEIYQDSRDYARLYTEIRISSGTFPGLWAFLLIVLGVLIVVIIGVSLLMRWIQHRRRQVLRQRIASGEVDLEALGIKRITVPQEHLNNFPLFIYIADPNRPESSASSHSMGEHRKGQPQQDNRKSSENVEALRSEKDEKSHGLPSVGQDHQDLGGIQLHDLQHRELSFAQYTCPICLDEFVSHKTALRELPCGHAFHPGCVDSFLTDSSSLCPMCKKSVLPRGYCPPKITNVMVRRERIIRRMRERVVVEDDGAHPFNPTHRRPSILRAGLGWPISPQPVRIARTASTIARPGQRSEEEPVGAGMSTVSVLISSVPEENSEARRAWARRRANAMLGISRTVEEEEQEAAARTPAWRKVLAAVFPGFH